MNTRTFLPGTLYYSKEFVQTRTLLLNPDNSFTVSAEDPTLEEQIQAWVNLTKNLIVVTSSLALNNTPVPAGVGQSSDETKQFHIETRSVVVTYAPAIRGEIRTYGQKTGALEELIQRPDPEGKGTDPAIPRKPDDVEGAKPSAPG